MIVYHFSWCILSSKFLLLFWHIWLPASRLLIFIISFVYFMLNICLSFGNFSIYFQHYYFSCLVLLSFFLVWQFNKLFAYWCNFLSYVYFLSFQWHFYYWTDLNFPLHHIYIFVVNFCFVYHTIVIWPVFFFIAKKFYAIFSIKLFYFVFIFCCFLFWGNFEIFFGIVIILLLAN